MNCCICCGSEGSGGWAPGSQSVFRLFGTAGAFFWNQDVHYVDPSGVYDYDDKGTSLSLSAGFEVGLGSVWLSNLQQGNVWRLDPRRVEATPG